MSGPSGADAYLDRTDGEYRVVLVSGAEVLIEKERFHDAYLLLPAPRSA